MQFFRKQQRKKNNIKLTEEGGGGGGGGMHSGVLFDSAGGDESTKDGWERALSVQTLKPLFLFLSLLLFHSPPVQHT